MPALNVSPTGADRINPDAIGRAVVTVALRMAEVDSVEIDFHSHRKGQFLLVQQGALSCEVADGLWIVPPRSALWIPGGVRHAVKATGVLEGYNAFIDPEREVGLPTTVCAVAVSPLLRELLIRSASLPAVDAEDEAELRLSLVLLDEIAVARVEELHLPMPADERLHRMVARMIDAPADRSTIETWARRAGMSGRTLARLIARETGMSFDRWRRQLAVMLAVKWMAAGGSIQQVAGDLGYESMPSFVTMFRKTLGLAPRRYMAERYRSGAAMAHD